LDLRQKELASAQALDAGTLSEHDLLRVELGASSAQADLASAQAALAQLQDAARRAGGPAPFSGEVSNLSASRGDQLAPGTPIGRVVNLDTLVLRFGATENDARRLQAGQAVLARFRGNESEPPLERQGTVHAVSRATDPMARTWTTEVHVDNKDHDLRAGAIAELRITVGQSKDGVLVPRSALVRENADEVIYRVAGDTVDRRLVAVGMRTADQVLILDGIDDGDQVVTAGQTRLKDGASVRVMTP